MVEVRTVRLTNYHASIVLSLSWMNNTNTFIYFLLYVQHKSQAGPGQVKPDLKSWINHTRANISVQSTFAPLRILRSEAASIVNDAEDLERKQDQDAESQRQLVDHGFDAPSQAFIKAITKRIVLLLGSLHLSLMAALGIWLWSDPRAFGFTDANSCTIDSASTMILGNPVQLGSRGLRAWSIAIYSLFLAPGLNLILPMGLFLGLIILGHNWRRRPNPPPPSSVGHPRRKSEDGPKTVVSLAINLLHRFQLEWTAWYTRLRGSPGILAIFAGLGILFTINLVFVVDIELILRQNRVLQGTAESAWTFGQILAMLLLVLPLRDLLETFLARQEEQRRNEHTASLSNAITEEVTMKTILDLIKTGANVNVTVEDVKFATALQLSASKSDTESATVLLVSNADPNLRGENNVTALQVASYPGSQDVIKLLLQHKADPNLLSSEYGTPLQAASYGGHVEIVKLLLERRADPNIQGGKYGTALAAARELVPPRWDIIAMLLEKGASLDTPGDILQGASSSGEIEVVMILLAKGIYPDIEGGEYGTALQAASHSGQREIVRVLLEKGANPNISGGKYGTALHAGSYSGQWEILRLLLEKGADPNIQGGQDGTVLQEASYRGKLEIVGLLLEKGADPNIQGKKYGTALQAASDSGRLEIVRLLLEKGADPNILGGMYGTALHAGSYNGELEIVRLLLENGADPNIPGGKYGTALQAASDSGELKIVRLLLEKGADPNIQGGNYGTALQAGSDSGELEIVRLLLEKGADPNIQGEKSGTALRAASDRGKLEIVRLLLEKGADPNIQGGEYGTALQTASDSGRLEIVRLLLEKGADPNIRGKNISD
ncbi:ankyrin repeat-containing domain protein [Mycena vulgaris]|nr:ankyrin repeat-containing domain protein [Mycena vulgaris]